MRKLPPYTLLSASLQTFRLTARAFLNYARIWAVLQSACLQHILTPKVLNAI